MDGSGDLTGIISNLIAAQKPSGSYAFSNVTLGKFLTIPQVTVGLTNAVSNGTETVSVDAAGAAVNVGPSLTGTITGDSTAEALQATYTFDPATPARGIYSLKVGELELTVPSVLVADASHVTLGFDPNAAAGQTLATIGSAAATITPLHGASVAVANLVVRDNGFSLGDATVSAGSFSLGGILQATNPSLSFSNVAYTAGSPLTGTITARVDSAALFGDAAGFADPGGSAAGDGLKLDKFVGSYDLASNKLALAAGGAELGLGKILAGTAADVAIAYDPAAASPVTVAAGTVHVTSPLFPGVAADATNLVASSAGISLDDASVADANPIALGGVATLTGLTFGLKGFSYSAASGAVAGTVGLGASTVALFPGHSAFNAAVTNFHGSYTLNSNALTLSADEVDLAFGQILKAQAKSVAFGWDGTNASVDLGSLALSSPEFPKVSGSLATLHGDNTGFGVATASLAYAGPVTLGSLLEVDSPTIDVANLAYAAATGKVTGTIGLKVGGVEVLPGSTAFSTKVTNFAGSYDLASQATTLAADSVVVTVGSGSSGASTGDPSLIVEADKVAFALTPNAAGTDDAVSIAIASASAQLPRFGLSGSISDLAITNDGFAVGGATLSKAGSVSAFGGKFAIVDPSVTLTNFGYSTAAGAKFDSDLTLTATEVDFNKGGSASLVAKSGTATPLAATISFTTSNVGDFTFTAGSVAAQVGPYLTLNASNIAIDTAPAAGGNFASFGSVTAAFKAGGLSVAGTGQDFAIDAAGHLATLPGFGVSLSLADANIGQIQWPSWLPIHVTTFGITWGDFAADPTNFVLDLSASITANIGSTVQVAGNVTDAKIDVGLLSKGQFPITSLAGAGISVSGQIGPATVSGGAFFSILDVDAGNNPIAVGDTTTAVARRIFYGGIEGALAIKGAAGFKLMIGLSQYGPLSGFVDASVPILLDPTTGLSITDLHAGIEFGRSLPSVADAHSLVTDPSFTPIGDLTQSQWEDRLRGQVIAQAATGSTDPFAIFRQTMVIDAGATLFSEYASQNAFRLAGDLQISTDGKILVAGTLTLGNSLAVKAGAYVDFSQLINSTPTKPIAATLLLYAQAPASTPILSLYGGLVIAQVTDSQGVIVPDTLKLTVAGEADATVPGLSGALQVIGTASLTANLKTAALDLSVGGVADLNVAGTVTTLAKLTGFVHFDIAADGKTPELFGAVAVDAGNIPTLAKLGLTLDAHAFLRFNTTKQVQSATLTPVATPEEVQAGTTPAPMTFNIPGQSASLYINGDLAYKDVFDINAQLYANFTVATLPNGKPDPELDIEINGNLSFGSASSGSNGTGDPLVSLGAQGILIVNAAGLAASLTVAVNSSKGLDDKGVDLTGTALTMVINTTGLDESFTVPAIPNEDGTGNAPGSNTKYTVSGTPQLPSGNTQAGPAATPYVLIAGTAGIKIKGFGLSGGFDFLSAYDAKSQAFAFRIDVNAMTLTVPSPTDATKSLLSLTASGGLLVSSAGIAAALSLTAGGISGTDFSVTGNYTFAVNTTATNQTLGGVAAPAGTVLIHVDGDVKVGPSGSQFDIHGALTFTINTSGLKLDIAGSVDLGSFGKLSTTDTLAISAAGIVGDLSLSGSLNPIAGVSFAGALSVSFDTTTSPAKAELDIRGDLKAGGGAIDLSGDFDVKVSGSGFHIKATDLSLAVFGTTLLQGNLDAETYKDNDGSTQFILDAQMSVGTLAGNHGGGTLFTIHVSPEVEVNTGSIQPADFAEPVSPHSAELALRNAQVNVFGFMASGTLIAQVSNGGFDIQIPSSDPLTISFFGIANMKLSGYFNSDGSFSVTGQIGFDVSKSGFELYGGIGATISSDGFAAWFYGGAKVVGIKVAEVDGYFSIDTSGVTLKASVTVLGISHDFEDRIGDAPKPPAQPAGLRSYSVPTTGTSGGTTQLSAQIGGGDGNLIADGNYEWIVEKPDKTTYPAVYHATDPVTFDLPGTYKVSLYQNNNGWQLIRQSNIAVIDLPPTISSLGVGSIYAAGTYTPIGGTKPVTDTVTPTPLILNPDHSTLTYVWSVTKNGKPFANVGGANTATPTIIPDAPPVAANPDNYVVTLTVTNAYGKSDTASSSFTTYNPTLVVVNTAADTWTPGSPYNFANMSLREALDYLTGYGDSQYLATIQFAPSLAGQTITLTQTEVDSQIRDGIETRSAIAFSPLETDSVVIDGSQAPGVTITDQGKYRLFFVGGGTLEFNDVNLSGGAAIGGGSTSSGGAIYVAGYQSTGKTATVILNNSTIANCQAVVDGTSPGLYQARGGAVYVELGATFSAYSSTIANNTATYASTLAKSVKTDAYGGAIFADGALNLVNATIVHNSAAAQGSPGDPAVGGVFMDITSRYAARPVFHNSIIADNVGSASSPNLYNYDASSPSEPNQQPISYLGSTNNIVPGGAAIMSGATGTIQAEPVLGSYLQRDGVYTYSILPGSPALGAGDLAAAQQAKLVTDARNQPRYATDAQGKAIAVDIGAFQRQTYLVRNTNASGPGSLAEALATDDDGSAISFAPLLSGQTFTLTSPITLTRDVTIIGPGDNGITFSGGGTSQLFRIAAGVNAELDGLTLSNAHGLSFGGAIYNQGKLTLTNDLLSNNQVLPYIGQGYTYQIPAYGGAIYNDAGGQLVLTGDTFSNNVASGGVSQPAYGGAIYNAASGTVTGSDLTFAGNAANGGGFGPQYTYEAGYGGAIFNAGTISLASATMSQDSATDGVGNMLNATESPATGAEIDNDTTGQINLVNSIVAGFEAGTVDVYNAGVFAGRSNLVMTAVSVGRGGATGGLPLGGVISTADPLLRPLAFNGGPTPTMIPNASSPAVNAATRPLLTQLDQRGFQGTYSANGELGATQLRSFAVTNVNDSGAGSLRQTIVDDVDQTPITFATTLAGKTIQLAAMITLTRDIAIVGLGASRLTIDGGKNVASSIYNNLIFDISSGTNVSISGLTMTDGGGFGTGWDDEGGAISNFGSLTLADDTFSNNSVFGSPRPGAQGVGGGGAIYNAAGATLVVTGSLFQNNTAQGIKGQPDTADFGQSGQGGNGEGGAIYNAATGKMTIINDTFTNNSATGGDGVLTYIGGPAGYMQGPGGVGLGGGIYNAGIATITNATIVKNSTANGATASGGSGPGTVVSGGGGSELVDGTTGTLKLYNTIAAYTGTAGGTEVINLGTATGSNNLVMSSTGLAGGLVLSTADPRLGLVANNGGPTSTYAINPGSLALGNGILGVAPNTDQRGLARVVGGRVDIGAYETQVIPATPAAGGPYTIHVGQGLVLNGAGTLNPSQSSLNYTWALAVTTTAGSTTTTPIATGVRPTVTWAKLNALGLTATNFAAAAITLTVDDGYGMNHTVTSQPVALTLLPAIQVAGIAPPTTAGAINAQFDSVIVTFSTPVSVDSINNYAATLSLDGGPDIAHVTTSNGVLIDFLYATPVPGATSTYQISGFQNLVGQKGQGQYVLTIDAGKATDAYGGGVGKASVAWIYDTTAPTSRVAPLPAREAGTSFAVAAAGSDPAPATGVVTSGVASYDLWSQADGGDWAYWTNVPAAAPSATFAGAYGHSYAFQSFARDAAGNLEAKPQAIEASTYVAPSANPTAAVTAVDTSKSLFVVSFGGAAAGANVLDHIDVYVAVDGGSPQLIGRSAAAGSLSYQAIADGSAHTYGFFAVGVDQSGNVQPTPTPARYDQTLAVRPFAAPAANAPEALTINHGAPSRSFVRYADVYFDNNAGIADLIAGNHVHLVKHNLDGTGGATVPLAGLLHAVDHAIEIDFGSLGLGGSPTTAAGDGYYEIDIDGAAHPFYFDRLFGDVNGDGTVDNADINLATQALGVVVPGEVVDLDGTGLITAANRSLLQRARGHKLGAGLHLDA